MCTASGIWTFTRAPRPCSPASGEWHKPQLLGVLDDRSRLCCHLQWYLDETAEALVHGLIAGIPETRPARARCSPTTAPRCSPPRPSRVSSASASFTTRRFRIRPSKTESRNRSGDRSRDASCPCSRASPRSRSTLLNTATQAWVEAGVPAQGALRDPARRRSPGTCAARASAASAPAPMRSGAPSAPRSRANSAAATAPSPSKACASRSPLRTARSCNSASALLAGTCRSVDLVDPRSGDHLATLLPLDKARNAERIRRVVAPTDASQLPPSSASRRTARAHGRLRRHRIASRLPPKHDTNDDIGGPMSKLLSLYGLKFHPFRP